MGFDADKKWLQRSKGSFLKNQSIKGTGQRKQKIYFCHRRILPKICFSPQVFSRIISAKNAITSTFFLLFCSYPWCHKDSNPPLLCLSIFMRWGGSVCPYHLWERARVVLLITWHGNRDRGEDALQATMLSASTARLGRGKQEHIIDRQIRILSTFLVFLRQ